MFVLLWNHATQHFIGRDYRACMEFYAAALGYAEANTKAAIARQLAQAHLAMQEIDRSARSAIDMTINQDIILGMTVVTMMVIDTQRAVCCIPWQVAI